MVMKNFSPSGVPPQAMEAAVRGKIGHEDEIYHATE